ncbi:hypothetical protein ES703_75438 [subsurface metagenome]
MKTIRTKGKSHGIFSRIEKSRIGDRQPTSKYSRKGTNIGLVVRNVYHDIEIRSALAGALGPWILVPSTVLILEGRIENNASPIKDKSSSINSKQPDNIPTQAQPISFANRLTLRTPIWSCPRPRNKTPIQIPLSFDFTAQKNSSPNSTMSKCLYLLLRLRKAR